MLREGRNKTKTKKTIRKTPLQRTEWGDPRYWPPDTQDGQCLWSTSSFLLFITWTKRERFPAVFYPTSRIHRTCPLKHPVISSKGAVSSAILSLQLTNPFLARCSYVCHYGGKLSCSCSLRSNGLLYSLFEDEDDETPVLRGSSPL